jgi:hypothetical protein
VSTGAAGVVEVGATAFAVNVAVMLSFAPIVKVQLVPVPVQAPDHPEKVEPDEGASVSVTDVGPLEVTVAVHDAPQDLPATVMVPEPEPALEAVSV